MKLRRAVLAVSALLVLALVAGGPASAAPKAKKPKPPKPHASGVWVGTLERHGNHWDYVGQSCPVDQGSVCAAAVVRYRINPTTPAAKAALKSSTGGTAVVRGDLRPAKDRKHNAMLKAKEITSGTGPSVTSVTSVPSVPSEAGTPGTAGQVSVGTPTQG